MRSAFSSRPPSNSVRGRAAASFLAEVAAAPDVRVLAGIAGIAGSGKSALLDDLEAQYRDVGIPVHRSGDTLDPIKIRERGAVLVDDAHKLSDSALGELHSLVDDRAVNLIVAYGFWPQSSALRRLTSTLEQHHPPVILGPLPREDIAIHAASVLGHPVSEALVAEVAELTGGMPWLVNWAISTIQQPGRVDPARLVSRSALEQLGYELEAAHGELHGLLLALSVGFDLSEHLPRNTELTGAGIDDLVVRARSAGLLLADGTPPPLVRKALRETTPLYQVRALQRTLVDTYIAENQPLDGIAEELALEGLKDQRIASMLEHAGDSLLATEPALASTLYDEADAAGASELSTAARRAQAASATGDLDSAARIVDDLLAHENVPDLSRAVDVAAAVWAQRGMLVHSAEMYRWLGASRVGSSAGLAAVAMIGVGDRDGAVTMLEASAPATPSLMTVAVTTMGRGLRDSVDGPVRNALPALIHASDMMTASGSVVPLPESPAALAAFVALHSGDLHIADSIIDEALAGGQCGRAARPRLLLLRAWVAMQRDQFGLARSAIKEALLEHGNLAPRENVLRWALEVGLARRTDDVVALVRAWHHARESILHVDVDLYSLIPLGEFMIAATRLRDSERLESPLAEAWALLGRLGDPPVWSVPLHWAAVQSAILVERPKDLAPHAAALVKASVHSHMASVLAGAGRAWIAVLGGAFQVASVEAAARELASVGLTWDGSRLAGHASARASERSDMARLLACARDLRPSVAKHPPGRSNEPQAGHVGSAPDDTKALSAREREVAQLVLAGKTYGEIGEAIFISPRTVEHHIARIRSRLGVTTRSELLAQLRLVLGANEAAPSFPTP